MSIGKSLRFEVLRRDGFACTYCGRKPPDVELYIDHVVPAALGGRDTPENLRTACFDCNAGKGSTPPDAELVAQVADDAQRWAAAMAKAAEEATQALAGAELDWFVEEWNRFGEIPAPSDWRNSVRRWLDLGLPQPVIVSMIGVAMSRRHVPADEVFSYFAGCCWRELTKMQERAAQLLEEAEPE